MMGPGEPTGVKHRVFTYRTNTEWISGRKGTLSCDGKPSIAITSPPEFGGERGAWTPEEMFVASVEMCHMAAFLASAEATHLPIHSYRSHANGVLEFVDGQYRFTRIVIFPTIIVTRGAREEDVLHVLQGAQNQCLVTNSIDSIVEVNPTIMVR
jgi:organic hydroperoxide reductase OsmC/OhrA